MSSTGFAATLELNPRPSLRALMFMFWAHVLVGALAIFAMDPGIPMLALALALALSWLSLRRHPAFGYGPGALRRLIWHADGRWTLQDGAGAQFDGQLLANSYRHPRLVVLRFRDGQGRGRSRVLLGDELEPEQMRRLQARLSFVHEGNGQPGP